MKKSEVSIVFLGTPEFAIASLRMLVEEGYDGKAVITQPDRPKGRGHKMIPTPVKEEAERLGLPVYQFESLRKEGLELLREISPKLMITAAYGQILSKAVLAVPELGTINVHGSLLPRYRGAAPIEWALINGEEKTGVTTMFTVRALDAGDMLEQDELAIEDDDTGGSVREKLSYVGRDTLKRTLEKLLDGTLERKPQDEAEVTYAPQFEKGFGYIDFDKETKEICDLIRGTNPEPGAYSFLKDGTKFKVMFARAADVSADAVPGTILEADDRTGLIIKTKDGAVRLMRIVYPGGREMADSDFLRGRRNVFIKGEALD